MGGSLGKLSAKGVMDEIRSLVPLYGGMDYGRLDDPANSAHRLGLQWPCPAAEHPGTPILYEKDFPRGKGKLIPVEYEESAEEPDYPWVLITGPSLFHSGSLSTMNPDLSRLQGESYVEISPLDAQKLGLADQQDVTLKSKYGKVAVKAVQSSKVAPGVLFIPYHFRKGRGQQLTGRDLGDVRVRVEKPERLTS